MNATLDPEIAQRVREIVAQADLSEEANFNTAVQKQLSRLAEMNMYAKRVKTVMALAQAEVSPHLPRDWAFEQPGTVSRTMFYTRNKDWFHHPLFREVFEAVLALYRRWIAEGDIRERNARIKEWNERMYERGRGIDDLVQDMLGVKLNDIVTVRMDTANPDNGKAASIPWAYRDIAPLAQTADKLVTRALGIVSEKKGHEITGAEGKPIEVTEKLPDDVLSRRMSILLAAAKQRKEQTEQDE